MQKLFTDKEFKEAKYYTKLPLQCKRCNKVFYLAKHNIQQAEYKHHGYTADFCSISCSLLFRNKTTRITAFCNTCFNPIVVYTKSIEKWKYRYCSHTCRAIWTNAHKIKGTKISKLELWIQPILEKKYPNLKFRFNKKDTISSELDIYIPSLRMAFELNGIFHYEPVFGIDKLKSIQNNDQRKMQACIERQIDFCIIDVSYLKYFSEKKAILILKIITDLIDSKLNSL